MNPTFLIHPSYFCLGFVRLRQSILQKTFMGIPVEKLREARWTTHIATSIVALTFRKPTNRQEFPGDLEKHPIYGKR